jgi:hypothetical protein
MGNYYLDGNTATLPAKNGGSIVLSLTPNSGRIVYRDKINTIIGIKHPGIELGIDQWGNKWYIHHHYKNTHPTIEREDAFSLGEPIFYDDRAVNYNQYQILERALAFWWAGQEYHWLWQNCQHFINKITKDYSHSDAVDQVSNAAMIFGSISGLIGLATKNKELTKMGFGIAAGGAVGKGLSRMK